MNKLMVVGLLVLMIIGCAHGSYMNDRLITGKNLLLGSAATSLDYNVFDNGDGQLGGDIRVYGIHSMKIHVNGYESVDLIKNDVCLYPHMFTILGFFLSENSMLAQRWACVKWMLPLTFSFKISDDILYITSSVFKYRFLTLYRAAVKIPLIRKENSCLFDDVNITVTVNGRSVQVLQRMMVQIYSLSALHPWAVLARKLFL